MEISVEKLMELYSNTLQNCGMDLLLMSDGDIEYKVFEEFDIGAISFLHFDSLNRLKQSGLINETVLQLSAKLRTDFMALQNTQEWDIDAVRNSERWRTILELADDIKLRLKEIVTHDSTGEQMSHDHKAITFSIDESN